MGFSLTRFTIHNLYGYKTISIPIHDNRIIMVGVNGLGKTTVITLLYFVLSRQWDRTLEYDFSGMTLEIDGQSIHLPRKAHGSAKTDAARLRRALSRSLPASLLHGLLETQEYKEIVITGNLTPDLLSRLEVRMGIPPHILHRAIEEVTPRRRPFDEEKIQQVDEIIKLKLQQSQILYLPTYRRIEKDLKLIFPVLEEQIQQFNRRKFIESREGVKSYIELVEFGMEDVEGTFRRIRHELNESARAELNSLAGGYLRDVIRGEGHTYNPVLFKELDEGTIVTILNRVEEETLNEQDKVILHDVIQKIKTNPNLVINEKEKYIAHFFSKLVTVHKALISKEESVNKFVVVCNKYLSDKYLNYDDKNYQITMQLESGEAINLRDLSSGEKQIVSLFSHLYLQTEGDVLFLIDEPELSLSVAWQKSLLPDILDSSRCGFLAAVTHSPFIFDNSLEEYAIDLASCITRPTSQ